MERVSVAKIAEIVGTQSSWARRTLMPVKGSH